MGFEKMQENEQRSAWLAIRYGCCASKQDVVDEEADELQAHGESDMRICYEQPRSVPQPCAEPLTARPSTSHSVSRHVSQWVSNSREFASSSRTSFSTLTRPRRSHSRPSIGRPTDFRHFGGLDGIQSMVEEAPMPVRRRRSFRPLELSIYLPEGCGRLSPLPDFEELEVPAQAVVRARDSRTNSISSTPSTSSYLIQRKPVNTISRRSSVQSQKSSSTHERRLSGTTMATMATPTLPFLLEDATESYCEALKPTVRRSRTSGTLSPARVLSRLPSPSRSRANTAPSRPGSLRRARTDVDEAIRELNTIVEERRASAYRSHSQSPALMNRPPPSPSHHVPYIAPSMRIHVRSETLSDIGSAFSASVNKALPTTPAEHLTLMPPPRELTSCRALSSNPVTPPAPTTPTSATSRLGAWLKRSTSSLTPSSPSIFKSSRPTTPKTADSFYQCEALPLVPTTRPSTSDSRTACHTRQPSDASSSSTTTTATITLFSPSASHSASPSLTSTSTASLPRKHKRIPAPLTLLKETEPPVDYAHTPLSARSVNAVPPHSPNYARLPGFELCAWDVGGGRRRSGVLMSPGAVGVAF